VSWLPLANPRRRAAGVLGDAVEDVVAHLRSPLAAGANTEGIVLRRLGGSGANLAVNLARQGVPTRMFGRVGEDATGERVAAELQAQGVDERLVRAGVTPTVIALVNPDGVPAYVTDSVANPAARVGDDLPRRGLEELALLHLGGWWVLGGLEPATVAESAAAARGAGAALTVDLGSSDRLNALGREQFRHLLVELEPALVVGNRAEFESAGLVRDPLPGATVVLTDGPRGASATAPGEAPVHVPAAALPAGTDTVGAGDAFLAGLLAAGLRGTPLRDALVAGHAAARAWLTRGS
jgi:sugar/nucleoside kinase (ribokinase family)